MIKCPFKYPESKLSDMLIWYKQQTYSLLAYNKVINLSKVGQWLGLHLIPWKIMFYYLIVIVVSKTDYSKICCTKEQVQIIQTNLLYYDIKQIGLQKNFIKNEFYKCILYIHIILICVFCDHVTSE